MKRNFGTSVSMVLHELHDISAFDYNGSEIVAVVERENILNQGKIIKL